MFSSPISSVPGHHPLGWLFHWWHGTRTHLNATCLRHVARLRLDEVCTIMFSSPISSVPGHHPLGWLFHWWHGTRTRLNAACQRQKFLIGPDHLGQKFTVPEQRVGRHRRRYVPRAFFIRDVDHMERNVVFSRGFLYSWHPIVGIGTLIRVVEDKLLLLDSGMLRAFPELRGWAAGSRGRYMRLIPQPDTSATEKPL